MSLDVTLLTPRVEVVPGSIGALTARLVNTDDHPIVVTVEPVGTAADAGLRWSPQQIEVPARSTVDAPVRLPVPRGLGVGEHAAAFEFRTEFSAPVLRRLTMIVASVSAVELRASPSPLRGRGRSRFTLMLLNREHHHTTVDLTGDSPELDVSFSPAHVALEPGASTRVRGRVRPHRRAVGESVQHNIVITARSTSRSTSTTLPFVQRPLFAYGFRSIVAAVVVIALWVGAMGLGAWRLGIWHPFGESDRSTASGAGTGTGTGTDDSLAPIGDGTIAPPGDGTGDATGGAGGTGDATGGAGGSGGAGDATGGAGGAGDATGGAGGSGGAGDATGGTGDATTGDGTGTSGTGDASTGGTPAGVEVSGTIDIAGNDLSGVTITPAEMQLSDLADSDPTVTSFAAFGRSAPIKIWSARHAPRLRSNPHVVQTEPLPAGPFAPDASGIWRVSLEPQVVWELTFRKPGFQPKSYVVAPEEGGAPIKLAVDLEPATGLLSGTVRGPGGPIENADVLITDGLADYQTVTVGNGSFSIEGLPTATRYTVLASVEGLGSDAEQVVMPATDDPSASVALQLVSGQSSLRGRIVDASDQNSATRGLAGAKIVASNGSNTRTTTANSDDPSTAIDETGTFLLPELDVGTQYSITVTLDGYRPAYLSESISVTPRDLGDVALDPLAARLAGLVVAQQGGSSDPTGLRAARITLVPDDDPLPIAEVQSASDNPGRFDLPVVPPGTYVLTVEHWQYATARRQVVVRAADDVTILDEDRVRVEVTDGELGVIDLGAPVDTDIDDLPLASLSLKIRDADTTKTCTDTSLTSDQCRTVENATVYLSSDDAAFEDDPRFRARLDTDPNDTLDWVFLCNVGTDGSPTAGDTSCNSGDSYPDYTITDIPIGQYSVIVRSQSYNDGTDTIAIVPGANSLSVTMFSLGRATGDVRDWTDPQISLIATGAVDRIDLIRVSTNEVFSTILYRNDEKGPDVRWEVDPSRLLPSGIYQVNVVLDGEDPANPGDAAANRSGYSIDLRQMIDPNGANVGPMQFEIEQPDSGTTDLRVDNVNVVADPYPNVRVRPFQPDITPAPAERAQLAVVPLLASLRNSVTGSLDCLGASAAVAVTVGDGGQVPEGELRIAKEELSKVPLRRDLDPTIDGTSRSELESCTLTVGADQFESFSWTFDATSGESAPLHVAVPATRGGNDTAPANRLVDVVLAPMVVGERAVGPIQGTLGWLDRGSSTGATEPIADATLTAADIVVGFEVGDVELPDETDVPPTVTTPGPRFAAGSPTTTSATSGGWDFGTLAQVAGQGTIGIDTSTASGQYSDATLTSTIGWTGSEWRQTVTITASDLAEQCAGAPECVPGVNEAPIDTGEIVVTLAAGTGFLDGFVTVVSRDPNVSLDAVGVSTALGTSGLATTFPVTATGPGTHTFDRELAAGTWTTTLDSLPDNFVLLASPPSGTISAIDDTVTQFVPVGGHTTTDFGVAVKEQGTVAVSLVTPDPGGGNVPIPTTGIGSPTVTVDDAATDPPTTADFRLDGTDGLDVSDVDPPAGSTAGTPHTIKIGDLSSYDTTQARVTYERTTTPGGYVQVDSNRCIETFVGSGVCKVPLEYEQDDLLDYPVDMATTGVTADFAPGTKYDLTIELPRFGGATGKVVGVGAGGANAQLCPNGPDDPKVQVVATPAGGDPLPAVAAACDGTYQVFGRSGVTYTLSFTHPDFQNATQSGVTFSASGSPTLNSVPDVQMTLKAGTLDLEVFGDTPGGTPLSVPSDGYVYVAITPTPPGGTAGNAQLLGTPAAPTSSETIELLPATGYRIELRSCSAASLSDPPPATVDATTFATCRNRFPAITNFDILRASASGGDPTTVDVPLLQVGGTIAVAVVFQNELGKPVCPNIPTTDSNEVVRRFDIDWTRRVAVVDGTEVTFVPETTTPGAAADATMDVEIATIPRYTDQLSCSTASGYDATFDLTFDDLIATGTHRFTFPAVPGFDAPTLTSGTAVDGDPYSFDLPVTESDPSSPITVTATYKTPDLDISISICEPGNNCPGTFKDLQVTFTSPDGVDNTSGQLVQGKGYKDSVVSYSSVSPDPRPYEVRISDTQHGSAADPRVACTTDPLCATITVLPGTTSYRVDFDPTTILVAVDVRLQRAGSNSQTFTVDTIQLYDGTSLAVASAQRCTVEGTDGVARSYLCLYYTPPKKGPGSLTLNVALSGFTSVTGQSVTADKGDIVITTAQLYQRATLEVTLSSDTPAPADLKAGVTVTATDTNADDGLTTADIVVNTCAADKYCVTVNPGFSYVFKASSTGYYDDATAAVAATPGMAPATMPSALSLKYTYRTITVTVDQTGESESSVVAAFGTDDCPTTGFCSPSGPVDDAAGNHVYTFSSLGTGAIPINAAAKLDSEQADPTGVVIVSSSTGRNVSLAVSGTAGAQDLGTVTVLPLLDVTGSAGGDIAVGDTIVASYADGDADNVTAQVVNTGTAEAPVLEFTFADLDVNADGTARTYTFWLSTVPGTTVSKTVTSSTTDGSITDTLAPTLPPAGG